MEKFTRKRWRKSSTTTRSTRRERICAWFYSTSSNIRYIKHSRYDMCLKEICSYCGLFCLSSSKAGIGGLPCTKADRGWMDTGQVKVSSARGVRTALRNMQGGVSASATGIPPVLFERAPFKCALLSVLWISVYTHVHAYTQKAPFSRLPRQFLYALICVDNCTNLPVLPWKSAVTWRCSNCCVTVRGHSALHLSDPLFKMPICSRMWDRDGILTKLVAIVADVNISLPWGW